jgi:hypothetical protein
MNNRALLSAKICLTAAAFLLLYESLLGCIYVLGIGFSTAHDLLTDFSVTMAFPVFLISLWSVRGAAIGLWTFFALQWIDICSNKVPPGFVNPFGWLHGNFLFISAILVSISAFLLLKVHGKGRPVSLLKAYKGA